MSFSIDQLLQTRRKGGPVPLEQIQAFVQGVTQGSISRPQAAAWLAFTFVHGLSEAETVALTTAMTDSGSRMYWGFDGPFIDKHSTGGVGDKVSLVLAPLWAELGLKVPMISGRGLGHTGGTLDKLEAIPGYRTDLAEERLKNILQEVGCFISGQTSELAPADRILYALRNETQTVECIPLIVGSILSKKLAEGLDRLVLDVKVGSGAFMQTMESAQALAQALVTTGKGAGIQTSALLTDMEQPLGEACGNALEVEEAIDCLQGGGPADLSALTVALAGHPEAARVLASGAAYERFCRMVAAQGGVLSKLKHDTHGPVQKLVLEAPEAGFIQKCDARTIGVAVFRLGAGRLKAEDPVHSGVGARIHCKVGDMVAQGQPLITLYHAEQNAELAFALVKQAVAIVERPCSPRSLVLGRFE